MFEFYEVVFGVIFLVAVAAGAARAGFEHVVEVLEGVDEAVVVLVSQNLVVQHLITYFICQTKATCVLASIFLIIAT